MQGIVVWAASAVKTRKAPPLIHQKMGPKLWSVAVSVLLAGVLIGLVPGVGHGQPVIDEFSFPAGAAISVVAAPGMNRQSETLVARLQVTSDTNYSIKVTVEPDAAGWGLVSMNDAGHSFIASWDDWGLGFDVAITEQETDGVGPPSNIPCAAPVLGEWCMGTVAWQHNVASPGDVETNEWYVHVRLVLVDEEDKTAGYDEFHDNARFVSLPSGESRVVDVMVVVAEE